MFAMPAAKRTMPCTALLLTLGLLTAIGAAPCSEAAAQTPTPPAATSTATAAKPAASPTATPSASPTASATPSPSATAAKAATPPAPAAADTAPAPAATPSATSLSADADIKTTEVSQHGLAGYTKLALIAAVFIIPFLLANWLSKLLRLPDQSLRFFFVLFATTASIVVMVVGWPPKLGIDLRGGVILVYQVKPPQDGQQQEAGTMDKLVGTIKRRLDPSNISEIVVRPFGTDKVEVIVPSPRKGEGGTSVDDQDELQRIKYKISTSGALEFRITANTHKHQALIEQAKRQQNQETAEKRQWNKLVIGRIADDKLGPIAKWVPIKPGAEAEFAGPTYTSRVVDRGSLGKELQVLAVLDQWNVTGEYLTSARAALDQKGRPAVNFHFNSTGAVKFGQMTDQNLPQNDHYNQLAIILDDVIQSAPRINSTISDSGIIEGDFTQKQVDDLAEILTAGGLPAALDRTPLSEQVVSATLGQDTIESGITSMLVATAAVILFMIFYYRFAGVVANLALILNVLLIVAFMIMFNAAFTLSGLAGLALTVGMAVDANVLIYERMREELTRGATLRMAIRNGFDRASITIIDANVTTLITAIVLYVIGTDQVKGFAVTLTVGILMNLFTAITCSRLLFDIVERNRWVSNLKFLQIMSRPNFDFIGKRYFCYGLSIVLLGIGLIGAAVRGSDLLNIDFTGGVSVTTVFDKPPQGGIAEVRAKVESVLPESTVQEVNSDEFPKGAGFKIVTSDNDRADVEQKLKTLFGQDLARYHMKVVSTVPIDAVGPSIIPPTNSKSSLENHSLDDIAAAPVAAEQLADDDGALGNDGITDELTGDACQGAAPTATATGPKPSATAAPTATPSATTPKPSATTPKPSATAAPGASPSASAAPAAATSPVIPPSTNTLPTIPGGFTLPGAGLNPPAGTGLNLPGGVNLPGGLNMNLPGGLNMNLPGGLNLPANLGGPATPFAGGTLVSLTFAPKISHAKLEDLVKQAVQPDQNVAGILYEVTAPGYEPGSSAAREDWQIRLGTSPGHAQEIVSRLESSLAQSPFFPSTEVIGAAVAGGAKRSAIAAMIVSLALVMAYVWFRFQNVAFGFAAILALVHDVLFTVGCLAVSRWLAPVLGFALVEPFKIDLTIVAALLTIIGYSINDTIVIFDRIREVRGKSPGVSGDLINTCLNQTLSRTILTSLTVFLVVLILYIWGGEGIHGFAFALVVGTVSGTYSTIYVASPILLWLYRKPNAATQGAKGAASATG